MASIPRKTAQWQPPPARLEGDRLLREAAEAAASNRFKTAGEMIEEQRSNAPRAFVSSVPGISPEPPDYVPSDLGALREKLVEVAKDVEEIKHRPAIGGAVYHRARVSEGAVKNVINGEIGVTIQAHDDDLVAIAGLAKTDGNFIVADGAAWTVESGATARASLGLTIGMNVQAYSANLDEYAAVNPTAAGLALLDDADAAAQRTTMGLGTSSVKNTGTSGDAVPLLNAANTWSAKQTLSGSAPLDVTYSEDGTGAGPVLNLTRVSATPAAGDLLGAVNLLGYDDAGNLTAYVQLRGKINDSTNTSEDGAFEVVPLVDGAGAVAFGVANGLRVGAPTGLYMGTGTINATGYYLNGTALSSTLFGVAVGSASGNLKALNADAGFSLTTTSFSDSYGSEIPLGGTWKAATVLRSDTTTTHTTEHRSAVAILSDITGGGANGPGAADFSLHVFTTKANYTTSLVEGTPGGIRVNAVNGEYSDTVAIACSAQMRQGTSTDTSKEGAITVIEASARRFDGTGLNGTTLISQSIVGYSPKVTGALDGTKMIGFFAGSNQGANLAAFAGVSRNDTTTTPTASYDYLLLGMTQRDLSTKTFSIDFAGNIDSNGAIEFRPSTGATPTANGDVVFQRTSNTQFAIKMRGTDGTVRVNTLTLA